MVELADTIQKLAQDPRFVGGRMGMVGVLHTWGRNLSYHPHVHYVIPGGGVAGDGTWSPSRASFLLPVKALSKVFRAKFRDALRQCDPDTFAEIPTEAWQKEWVVHSQPVGNGLRALKYLAPYIFRVACTKMTRDGLKGWRLTCSFRGHVKHAGTPTDAHHRRPRSTAMSIRVLRTCHQTIVEPRPLLLFLV